MKLAIKVTVNLDPAQVRSLVTSAKSSGHGFDGAKPSAILIRRFLESKVKDAVTYCHERVSKD